MRRRQFLKRTALVGTSTLAAMGTHTWVWSNKTQASNPPRLIVIFLRGAADGLNIVVPYQESAYYELRPTLALATPGELDGVLDLNGEFGLHPSLQPILPQWQAKHLAFVHASGSPDPSRSHFQAQDYMSTGAPGDASMSTGWLNRLVSVFAGNEPTRAVNMGVTLPLIFAGPESVASLAVNGAGRLPLPLDRPRIQSAFDQLYEQNHRLSQVYQEGRIARDILLQELDHEMTQASRGAPSPSSFETSARYVAQLMTGDANTQVAFMELGGWDTHVNQSGVLQRHLASLGTGLATLAQELGAVYQDTAIVVMSEFGRTVAENGNGGTDHGHGNVMWLMGGGIQGQQIHGEWPGLEPSEQYQERDLAITTDFRDVLSSLLNQHFALSPAQLAQIFPNHSSQNNIRLL